MDIEELNGNWNSLMNAAIKLKMAGTLDARNYGIIERASENWRKWYKHAGPLDDMFATATTAKFVRRYRAALKIARAAGVRPKEVLEMTALEQASDAGNKMGWMIGIGLGLAGLTAIGLVVASTRGTGQGCD